MKDLLLNFLLFFLIDAIYLPEPNPKFSHGIPVRRLSFRSTQESRRNEIECCVHFNWTQTGHKNSKSKSMLPKKGRYECHVNSTGSRFSRFKSRNVFDKKRTGTHSGFGLVEAVQDFSKHVFCNFCQKGRMGTQNASCDFFQPMFQNVCAWPHWSKFAPTEKLAKTFLGPVWPSPDVHFA